MEECRGLMLAMRSAFPLPRSRGTQQRVRALEMLDIGRAGLPTCYAWCESTAKNRAMRGSFGAVSLQVADADPLIGIRT